MNRTQEGKEAYYDGLDIDDCPYSGDDASDWCAGWADAEDNDPLKDDIVEED